MPDFQPYTLDLAACRVQVGELKAFLGTSPALGEKALRKFLLPRTHLRPACFHALVTCTLRSGRIRFDKYRVSEPLSRRSFQSSPRQRSQIL